MTWASKVITIQWKFHLILKYVCFKRYMYNLQSSMFSNCFYTTRKIGNPKKWKKICEN